MSGTKFISALLFLTLIASFVFVSCEKSDPYANLNLDVEQVALDLRNNGKFVEELERLDDDTVPYVYDLGSPDKIVIYTGSGATPEEIIVAEYDDADARASALQKLNDHLTSQRKTFDDYNAEYRPLLNSPLLVELGKYLIYCVSDDYDASEAVLSRYTEGES